MSRYLGPVCRLCRREGEKLFLKGERCYSHRCAIERRQSSAPRGAKMSEYKLRLREKQKMKRYYGLLEGQFRRYFEKAFQRKGVTGDNLLISLERRMDNAVYRLGFAPSRREARQLVRHGHFSINGRAITYPGAPVGVGDVIEVRSASRETARIKESVQLVGHRGVPRWLNLDAARLRGEVTALPARDDIAQPFNEQLVIELYSK